MADKLRHAKLIGGLPMCCKECNQQRYCYVLTKQLNPAYKPHYHNQPNFNPKKCCQLCQEYETCLEKYIKKASS